MKEDYLWDKKGSDPEIEKLENVLKAFRQKEHKVPIIATQAFEFDKGNGSRRSPRRLFTFGFASFACLTVAIFGIALFQMMRSGDSEIVKTESIDKAEKHAANTAGEISESTVTQAATTETKISAVPAKNTRRDTGRAIRFRKIIERAERTRNLPKSITKVSSPRKTDDQEVVLTKEEKYAYDQLMLGLSITSSNLKIVRDKANGIRITEKPKKSGS